MPFELPPLPYARDALVPYISNETLDYHYGKHHLAYVNKLNGLIANTDYADQSLEDIIKNSSGAVFNNAAQVWNHTFYWHCLSPETGQQPSGSLLEGIRDQFGSVEQFMAQFTETAVNTFGSGWAWLVSDHEGGLSLLSTSNAQNPLTTDLIPLLTCDVWEHAYYIDTRNDRLGYLNNFWQIVNWQFVQNNYDNL